MAGSLNKVLLIGRLGADPEIKQMVNGKSVARLSLATSQSWKDKNTGEKKEKTEWHRIVVFNEGLVNVIQQYLKKGAQIYVEGQLTTRKWKDEQSGQDKYSTEIVLQGYNTTLTMLGGGNTGERKEKTEWHRVVVFNEGLVNVVQQYLKKGAQVYVEGQLTTRKWKDEQSGQDKYSTEIVIQGYNSSLTMLGGGNSSGGIQNDTTQQNNIEDSSQVSDMDDEIPF